MPKPYEFHLDRDFVVEKALLWIVVLGTLLMLATPAFAGLIFSTGNPDGKIATASRPQSNGKIEILDLDWSRVGTDIMRSPTGGPPATFNSAFSISGVPGPGTLLLFGVGLSALWDLLRRKS